MLSRPRSLGGAGQPFARPYVLNKATEARSKASGASTQGCVLGFDKGIEFSGLAVLDRCRGQQSGSNPPSPFGRPDRVCLAQQDELRNGVWPDPDDRVLIKVNADGFGRLQSQAQREITFLCWPLGAFFAAGALNAM